MGREVKRVPLDFQWAKKVWWGYVLDAVSCQLCEGSGKNASGRPVMTSWGFESEYCQCCEGEGTVHPKIEVPEGIGYQMWETTSEGSPISPVFEKPEDLARWLANNEVSAFGAMTASYENWLGMIQEGSAPDALLQGGQMISGVEAVAKGKKGGGA